MIGKSIRRCVLLLLAGTALQLSTGGIDASVISYPWGVILALNYLYALIFLAAFSDRWKFVRGLYERSAEISSLAAMLVMTILFGLIRQDGDTGGITGQLGFTRMTSSWIFNIFLFYWMTVMGLKAIDDLRHFRQRRLPNVIMHPAFFVVVPSAFFGSGDKVRVKVSAEEGIPVHEGITSSGQAVRLPFSLMLEDFKMEEYPPKIHLLSRDGLSQEYVTIEKAGDRGGIDGLQIECLEYLDMAGCMPGDSLYVQLNHIGATTAVLLKAENPTTGEAAQGWISCGSHIFDEAVLTLPDGRMLVMPRREARKYLSVIEVDDNEGRRRLETGVNNPGSIGGWKIYQSGYDSGKGRWSTVSVLECVKDGWYGIIRIALWMILGAGIWIFLFGWRKRRDRKEI